MVTVGERPAREGVPIEKADALAKGARSSLVIARAAFLFAALGAAGESVQRVAAVATADPFVETQGVRALLAIALTAFLVAGFMRVRFHPRAWSIALAALLLFRAIVFVRAGGTLGMLAVAPAFVLATWAAGRSFSNTDAGGADALALRTADRRNRKRAPALGFGILGVGALLTGVAYVFGMSSEPIGTERLVAAFQSRWDRHDPTEIESLFRAEEREARVAGLAQSWTRWARIQHAESVTFAEDPSHTPIEENSLHVTFVLEGESADLLASFSLDGSCWKLDQLDLLQPPVVAALREFARAWNASDRDGLAELGGEEGRAYLHSALARVHDEHAGIYPVLHGKPFVIRKPDGRVWALFNCDPDERNVETEWVQAADGWRLLEFVGPRL